MSDTVGAQYTDKNGEEWILIIAKLYIGFSLDFIPRSEDFTCEEAGVRTEACEAFNYV